MNYGGGWDTNASYNPYLMPVTYMTGGTAANTTTFRLNLDAVSHVPSEPLPETELAWLRRRVDEMLWEVSQ